LNAIGFMLLGSIAHATGFALAGALFYLALRRASPAAGALSAACSLLLMGIISLVVLGPWPVWWNISSPRGVASLLAPASRDASIGRAQAPNQGLADGIEPTIDAQGLALDLAGAMQTRPGLSASTVLEETDRALAVPARAQRVSTWSWPEWLAIGFFASLCWGFGRLGLGVLAVARLRSRSRPLVNSRLAEEIALLSSEVSCTRGIEIRESSELETPATLGWRQPLLLLPFDWRDWSQTELRAVLAHEMAHVVRGDFLTGLIAQISVAIHFYHPLAHWLAKRMRLEQELAADAWGAALSGGSPCYLVTLAQMALRREGRGLAGQARAFLPSRGTLITRIEMLRNTNAPRFRPLSFPARAALIGTLAALALVVAGLRGPVRAMHYQSEATGAEIGNGSLQGRPRGNAGSVDLSFLPAETRMFLAVRPASLLEHDEVKSLVRSIQQGANSRAPFVIPLEETDQLIVFWEGFPEPPGQASTSPLVPPPSGIVIHSSKAQNWKTGLEEHFGAAEELQAQGQVYLRFSKPLFPGWCGLQVDDRTLILAGENTLRDLIQDRKAPAPSRFWDQALDKSVKGHLIAGVETRWLRRRLAQATPPEGQAPSPFGTKLETIAPLLGKAQFYVVSIDAARGIDVDVRAVTMGADEAKPVAETMQAVVTLARNMVEGLTNDTSAPSKPVSMKHTLEIARSLLSQAKIETSSNVVSLHSNTGIALADVAKQLAPAVTTARSAARRTMSVNNLKQIGIAFHNYHDANGHFPSPALLGGERKQFPFSWRVALLPYLEQDGLYRQYHFDEPWDGPHNKLLIEQMPAVYSAGGKDGTPANRSKASYFVFAGPATALGSPSVPGGKNSDATFAQITDGLSNTILVVEAQRDIPWTKPEDIPFDPDGQIPALGGLWPDGFNVLMGDGSVRFVKSQVDPITLKALITRAGGEAISFQALDPGPRR
jgi:beta-lactamase regulating signal transducer with metallopeptidase domain